MGVSEEGDIQNVHRLGSFGKDWETGIYNILTLTVDNKIFIHKKKSDIKS